MKHPLATVLMGVALLMLALMFYLVFSGSVALT